MKSDSEILYSLQKAGEELLQNLHPDAEIHAGLMAAAKWSHALGDAVKLLMAKAEEIQGYKRAELASLKLKLDRHPHT